MLFDREGRRAQPGERSICPSCEGELLAKCGTIVAHHWAHAVAECDPWAEPESDWHIDWKLAYRDRLGAAVEVPMGPHRADVVLPDGRVVELQSNYLSAKKIADREAFYGDMLWIYQADRWVRRVHFGGRGGFWWKHGAKSMVAHKRPVWWHVGDELWRVHLSIAPQREYLGSVNGEGIWSDDGERVLGVITQRIPKMAMLARPPAEQLSMWGQVGA